MRPGSPFLGIVLPAPHEGGPREGRLNLACLNQTRLAGCVQRAPPDAVKTTEEKITLCKGSVPFSQLLLNPRSLEIWAVHKFLVLKPSLLYFLC